MRRWYYQHQPVGACALNKSTTCSDAFFTSKIKSCNGSICVFSRIACLQDIWYTFTHGAEAVCKQHVHKHLESDFQAHQGSQSKNNSGCIIRTAVSVQKSVVSKSPGKAWSEACCPFQVSCGALMQLKFKDNRTKGTCSSCKRFFKPQSKNLWSTLNHVVNW